MQDPQDPHRPPECGPLPGRVDATQEREQRRPVRVRAVIAATAVAVLALGGTVAYAATSNNSGGGSPSAAPSSSSSEGPGGRHDRGGPWFGPGGGAAHGEATVKDPRTGDWVVRVWQRGTVQGTAGDRVTVKSEDGASWTWTVGPDTRVSSDGASGSGTSALTKGDEVFVVGSRSGDTNTADRILSGDFGARDRDGRDGDHDGRHRGGFPGHGPWGHDDDRSPAPTVSGSPT